MARPLIKLLITSAALLAVGWSCSIFGDKCDPNSWCDGDKLMWCEVEDSMFGSSTSIESNYCDVMCLEWKDEQGNDRAACVLSDEPCPANVDSFCQGTDVISCGSHGYPFSMETCGSVSKKCVASPVIPEAFCSYLDQHCDEEGSKYCYEYGDDPQQYDTTYLKCADGVWREEGACTLPTNCLRLQLTDGSWYDGCFFSDEPCPSWATQSYCIGNNIGYCANTGFPESNGQICFCGPSDSYCLDLGDPPIGEAHCVKSKEPCADDDVQVCIDNWVCDCTNIGYPEPIYNCSSINQLCVIYNDDGHGDCVY